MKAAKAYSRRGDIIVINCQKPCSALRNSQIAFGCWDEATRSDLYRVFSGSAEQ